MIKRSQTRLALLEGFQREIESTLREKFPTQRFYVRLSPQYRDFVDINWSGGPTKMEVRQALVLVTWRDEYRTMNLDVTCQREP